MKVNADFRWAFTGKNNRIGRQKPNCINNTRFLALCVSVSAKIVPSGLFISLQRYTYRDLFLTLRRFFGLNSIVTRRLTNGFIPF